MKRFLDRIEAKALDNSQPAVSVVAFGDSVTQGFMEHSILEPSSTYLRLLQPELEAFFPSTSFDVLNAGVNGESATQALTRLDRDVISRRPDLVIIAYGLNDAVGGICGESKFHESLSAIIRKIQIETAAEILILTPPFMASESRAGIHPSHLQYADSIIKTQTSGSLAQYAAIIRSVAAETGITLVDIHREWQRLADQGLDTHLWLRNRLNHPGSAGHHLTKTLILHAIIQAHLTR